MRLLGFIALLAAASCSKLTSPPGPEPIASDTPVTMASAPTIPSAGQGGRVQPSLTALAQPPSNAQPPPVQGGELKIEDLVQGHGPAVKNGDVVSVHYTGTLLDGSKFDSSRDRGQPYTTPIPGNVIQGWNRGIIGMKAGGRRKLTIPPSMAYGAMARPKIPANSTLVFDIELMEVKANPNPTPNPNPRQPRVP